MRIISLVALAGVVLSACASTASTEDGVVNDPYEGWNRDVFAFNEAVDKAVLEPVARGYRVATPGLFREGVRNVLANLNAPVVFVNDVLQAEPERAGTTFTRFALNTTIGIGGIFDVASEAGLEKHSEDFGQTLAVWGVDSGPFLVLPLLGPSNPRDLTGLVVDRAFDPLTWTQFEDDDTRTTIAITRGVMGAISTREQLIETFETLREQPEPYIAYRRAYFAQRETAIRNGQEDPDAYQNLPDFDDAFFDEEEESE